MREFSLWRLIIFSIADIIPFLKYFLPFSPVATLDVSVLRGLRSYGPVVALGRAKFSAAGQIVTEDEIWQDDVRLLMKHARWIVCAPSKNEGTLWEVREVFHEEYTDKTVFVMLNSKSMFRADGSIEPREEWTAASRSLENIGAVLPTYSDKGCLLFVNRKGDEILRTPLRLLNKSLFSRFFRKIETFRNSK